MIYRLTILFIFLSDITFGQADSVRCISPLDITHAEWSNLPTADRIYYQSLMLQNERWNFYTNLQYWVDSNGSKDLRAKIKMTEKNFLLRIKNQSLTPDQIKAIMNDFVPPHTKNMYGHDISKEPEHELGDLEN